METAIAPTVINEVLQYIQQHLAGNLSLDRLAKYAGYSSFHLHRLIKERTGDSVGNYIKTKRIETAAFLLSLTDQPISQVKELVGYSNDAAFSKAFHQLMRCSPREFRKQKMFNRDLSALPQEYISLEYHIERKSDWQALSFPSICNYFDNTFFDCWKPAKEFLTQSTIQYKDIEFWGTIHECPNVTGKEKCRFDATIQPASFTVPADIFNTKYKGGKFAVFQFCAPYAYFKDITIRISQYILEDTSLEFREGYSFLRYHQDPITNGPDYIMTKWYLPVK